MCDPVDDNIVHKKMKNINASLRFAILSTPPASKRELHTFIIVFLLSHVHFDTFHTAEPDTSPLFISLFTLKTCLS